MNPITPLVGRYAAILVTTLVLFVVEPVLASEHHVPWGLLWVTLFVVLGSLRALWRSRFLVVLVGSLGLGFLSLEALEPVFGSSHLPVLTDAAGIAFMGALSYGILADVFTRDQITVDTVFGASAVYLLIGLLFARLFLMVEFLEPGSFVVSDGFRPEIVAEGWRGSGILHYFSIVTLTTVGYGDVSPVAPLARNLAAVEGIVGQLYIAAVIARLVALYTSAHPRGK